MNNFLNTIEELEGNLNGTTTPGDVDLSNLTGRVTVNEYDITENKEGLTTTTSNLANLTAEYQTSENNLNNYKTAVADALTTTNANLNTAWGIANDNQTIIANDLKGIAHDEDAEISTLTKGVRTGGEELYYDTLTYKDEDFITREGPRDWTFTNLNDDKMRPNVSFEVNSLVNNLIEFDIDYMPGSTETYCGYMVDLGGTHYPYLPGSTYNTGAKMYFNTRTKKIYIYTEDFINVSSDVLPNLEKLIIKFDGTNLICYDTDYTTVLLQHDVSNRVIENNVIRISGYYSGGFAHSIKNLKIQEYEERKITTILNDTITTSKIQNDENTAENELVTKKYISDNGVKLTTEDLTVLSRSVQGSYKYNYLMQANVKYDHTVNNFDMQDHATVLNFSLNPYDKANNETVKFKFIVNGTNTGYGLNINRVNSVYGFDYVKYSTNPDTSEKIEIFGPTGAGADFNGDYMRIEKYNTEIKLIYSNLSGSYTTLSGVNVFLIDSVESDFKTMSVEYTPGANLSIINLEVEGFNTVGSVVEKELEDIKEDGYVEITNDVIKVSGKNNVYTTRNKDLNTTGVYEYTDTIGSIDVKNCDIQLDFDKGVYPSVSGSTQTTLTTFELKFLNTYDQYLELFVSFILNYQSEGNSVIRFYSKQSTGVTNNLDVYLPVNDSNFTKAYIRVKNSNISYSVNDIDYSSEESLNYLVSYYDLGNKNITYKLNTDNAAAINLKKLRILDTSSTQNCIISPDGITVGKTQSDGNTVDNELITKGLVTSLISDSGGNIFDQDLNKDDDVDFRTVKVNSNIYINDGVRSDFTYIDVGAVQVSKIQTNSNTPNSNLTTKKLVVDLIDVLRGDVTTNTQSISENDEKIGINISTLDGHSDALTVVNNKFLNELKDIDYNDTLDLTTFAKGLRTGVTSGDYVSISDDSITTSKNQTNGNTASNEYATREFVSGLISDAGGNIFDQDLNTTDDVAFNSMVVSDIQTNEITSSSNLSINNTVEIIDVNYQPGYISSNAGFITLDSDKRGALLSNATNANRTIVTYPLTRTKDNVFSFDFSGTTNAENSGIGIKIGSADIANNAVGFSLFYNFTYDEIRYDNNISTGISGTRIAAKWVGAVVYILDPDDHSIVLLSINTTNNVSTDTISLYGNGSMGDARYDNLTIQSYEEIDKSTILLDKVQTSSNTYGQELVTKQFLMDYIASLP